MVSCGTSKKIYSSKTTTKSSNSVASTFNGKLSSQIKSIVNDAEDYLGVPYKFGGNNKSGLDCSGLVCQVFDQNGLKLPRRSSEQALQGKPIRNEEIKPGDLLFFATSGGSKVSHVGIVHHISEGEIMFIHSSTSKGVIISSLYNNYWSKAFLFARRVL